MNRLLFLLLTIGPGALAATYTNFSYTIQYAGGAGTLNRVVIGNNSDANPSGNILGSLVWDNVAEGWSTSGTAQAYDNMYIACCYKTNGASPYVHSIQSPYAPGSWSGQTINFYIIAGPGVSNWYTAHLLVTNVSGFTRYYGVLSNGVWLEGLGGPASPGGTFGFDWGGTNWVDWSIAEVANENDQAHVVGTYNPGYGTNTTNPIYTNRYDIGGGGVYSGGTNSIPGGTVGDNAIYGAIQQLASVVERGSSNHTTVNVSVTNNLTALSTNDIPNLLDNWQGRLGSWLAGNGGLSGAGTNQASAEAVSGEHTSAGEAAIDDMKDQFNLVASSGVTPGSPTMEVVLAPANGGVPEMKMFASLMPGDFGNMWDFFRGFVGWILVAWFFAKVIRDGMEVVRTAATAQQFHIPKIDFNVLGTGGNWGVAITPVLIMALLVTFAAMLAVWTAYVLGANPSYMATLVLGPVGSGTTAAGPLAVGVANGLQYLLRAFPLDMCVSLAVAYFVWRLTLTNALFVATMIVRALVG